MSKGDAAAPNAIVLLFFNIFFENFLIRENIRIYTYRSFI
uniref:Uncharacterized protein n=1 Tax=Podoviridae sp. ctXBg1 TaxID=2827739 RepID=A0A8S5SSA1_9CAUD|nr:MAG TPA: hypothetical protein [Podoviridae sp. ctXBg1]